MATVQQTFEAGVAKPDLIKTTSYDQDEILQWILNLYCPGGFELDPTYSQGNFYKKIPQPKLKFDISPQTRDTIGADCRRLPLKGETITSIIFDPPFVAAMPSGEPTGIITKRFGYYKNIQTELWGMYHNAISEFYRILNWGGCLL